MSKYFAKGVQIFVDTFVLSVAYWLAFMLRFELNPSFQIYKLLFFTWPYVVLFKYLVLSLMGIPRFSWRYVGLQEAKQILFALCVASGVLVGLRLGLAPLGGYSQFVVIPLGVLVMDFVLAYMGITGIRVVRRMVSERVERELKLVAQRVRPKRTILIGSGQAGVMVAKEIRQNPKVGIEIVGYVDDNPMKIGTIIHGHRVLGDTDSLLALKKVHQIEQAIITIASVRGDIIRRIVKVCETCDLPVKIIPGIYEILEGTVNLSRIREVTIEDLLGRDAVELDLDTVQRFISGKRVLVTGAGGSIGSELCRQISRFFPNCLILLDQSENMLFKIHNELNERSFSFDLVPCIADVCDSTRLDEVFTRFQPHVIFHAAAHKHVPMMEWNPGEALKNNVFGTRKVADAADRHGAETFVMISTDKAVNPTSVMGASKRAAELYVQALSQRSKTNYVAVRFGNVLGSAGSVIPIFKEQIRKGGPVTVTHPEMKRYFMTIPEACQLVMQAATMGEGGEIFVLDMGEPVKIVDLARDLIRLSGFALDEIGIEFTGTRPGEKLFEELSTKGEDMAKTRHPKIYIGKIAACPLEKVEKGLQQLEEATNAISSTVVRKALSTLVPEMQAPVSSVSPSEPNYNKALSDRPPTSTDLIH